MDIGARLHFSRRLSDAPEGDLAGLVPRDQSVCGASRQRAHAVVMAVQRIVGRRAEGAEPPAPHQLQHRERTISRPLQMPESYWVGMKGPVPCDLMSMMLKVQGHVRQTVRWTALSKL